MLLEDVNVGDKLHGTRIDDVVQFEGLLAICPCDIAVGQLCSRVLLAHALLPRTVLAARVIGLLHILSELLIDLFLRKDVNRLTVTGT